jgi:hypothetical protein
MSRQVPNTGSSPSPAPGGPAPAGPPAAPSPREYVRILVIAALLGAPVAVAAAAFMSLSHGLTTLMWTTVPDGAGWTAPPWWYVLAVPAIAGLLVAAAVRLPGHGGEPAVAGIGLARCRRSSFSARCSPRWRRWGWGWSWAQKRR